MSAPVNVMPSGGGVNPALGSMRSTIRKDETVRMEFFDPEGNVEAEIECRNWTISRAVAAIEAEDIPLARHVAAILNRHWEPMP